jgi:hypothetical protein
MSDTNTPDDASDNQDIELPDQLTQAEFDTCIDHDQDTQFHGILTNEDIAASLLSEEPTMSRDQPDDSDDDEPEERLPITFHHADTCLKDLRRVLEERGNTDTDFTLFYSFE